MKQQHEIVVIGAGLTGLSTAFHLHRQGRDVVILEKADRVGGQIHTYHENGFTFESGPNTGVVSLISSASLVNLGARKAPIPMSLLEHWLPVVLASRSMSMPLILSSLVSMRAIR